MSCHIQRIVGDRFQRKGKDPLDCLRSLSLYLLQLSEKSRFYVLHDWSDGVYGDADSAMFPVSQISDIMLKTMGIWKVVMGHT